MRLDLGGCHDRAVIGALEEQLNFSGVKQEDWLLDLRRDIEQQAWIDGETGLHKHHDQRPYVWDVRGAWRLFAPTATPEGACQPGEPRAEQHQGRWLRYRLNIRLHEDVEQRRYPRDAVTVKKKTRNVL